MKPPYATGSVPSLPGHAIVPIAFTVESPPAPVSPEFIGSRNCTNGVHCQESAGTGPVNLKVVSNECCLGKSPWTN